MNNKLYSRFTKRADKRRLRKDLLNKFGIHADQYEAMLKEQNFVCAICKLPDICERLLAVDHCHTTKKVRGLLCTNCNMAIGKFQDNIQYMKNAIEYLQRIYEVPNVEDTIIHISHNDRPNWKMLVITPDGMFPSMVHAAKFYNVHETTVRGWCLENSKRKKKGFSCKKMYVSMNELKDFINGKNKSI